MKRALVLLAIVLAPACLQAQQKQVSLDNGLKALAVQRTTADVAAWSLVVRYPAAAEDPGRPGLRALTQQVLMDGLLARLGAEPANSNLRIDKDAGGAFGFGTEWEYVEARGKVCTDDLGDALKLLAGSTLETKPTQQSLDAARVKIVEANADTASNIAEGTFYLFRQALEGDEAAVGPVYAGKEQLDRIALTDVTSALARYYVPGNAFLTVVTPLPVDAALETARKAFGSVPQAAVPEIATLPPRPTNSRVRVGDVSGSDRASLIVGVGLPAFGAPGFQIGQVIAEALGGKDGRIERDKSLFQAFGLSEPTRPIPGGAAQVLDEPLGSRSYLAIHAYVAPEELGGATDALESELLAFVADGLADGELERAKTRVIGSNARISDNPQELAARLNLYQLYGLDPNADREFASTVSAITEDQVTAFARQYFTRVAVGVRCPD